MSDKDDAKRYAEQLRNGIQGSPDCRRWLDGIVRYTGELRRELAASRAREATAAAAAESVKQQLVDVSQQAAVAAAEAQRQHQVDVAEISRLLMELDQIAAGGPVQVPPPAQLHLENLDIGPYAKPTSNETVRARIKQLRQLLPRYWPELTDRIAVEDKPFALLHQSSLAAYYNADEYTLTGMVVKFIGLHDREVRIIGDSNTSYNDSLRELSVYLHRYGPSR